MNEVRQIVRHSGEFDKDFRGQNRRGKTLESTQFRHALEQVFVRARKVLGVGAEGDRDVESRPIYETEDFDSRVELSDEERFAEWGGSSPSGEIQPQRRDYGGCD